jgi:nucleoside-triphosphatase
MKANNFLITGEPGVGKTTLIRKVAEKLADRSPIGFYTREIREQGRRVGFELLSLDGARRILSHVRTVSPHRVGKYGVDTDGFECFLASLDFDMQPSAPVIIDEIGKMECFSDRFRTLVWSLLDADRTVIATVARKGGGFISRVRYRQDVELIEVTRTNRNDLDSDIIGRLHR